MTTQDDSPTPLVSEWTLLLDSSPYKLDIQYTNLDQTSKYIDTLNIATSTTTTTTKTTTTTTTILAAADTATMPAATTITMISHEMIPKEFSDKLEYGECINDNITLNDSHQNTTSEILPQVDLFINPSKKIKLKDLIKRIQDRSQT